LLLAGTALAQSEVYGPPVPPDLQQQAAPGAAGEAMAIDDPAAIPDGLAQAASRAVRTYPSIRAGEAAIRASGADIRAARWQRFPSVLVEGRTFSDRSGNPDATVTVNQPLWTGGSISATVQRAQALQRRAEAQLAETVNDIALRLLSAYYEIARGARREAILRESLAEHQRLVESMARRVEQEVSPRSDLDLAISRTAQVQQDLSLTVAQRYAAQQRFAELVGDANADPGPVPAYSPQLHHPSTEGAVAQAIACDPTRQRFQAEAEVATAERRIAEGEILPSLSAQYSRSEVFGDRVGLVLRAQTNGGLSPLAAAQGARLRQQASQLQIATAERELRERIIVDVVENSTSRARIESGGAAARSSANVTESFMRQFVTGRRTWLDVMNAVRESNAAQIGLAESETSAMASAARLLLRTCQWRPDLTGPVEQ